MSTILVILLGLMSLTGFAAAQGQFPVVCGGLSDEDCAILQSAQDAALTLESADVFLDFGFTLTGLPGSPTSAAVNLSGEGAYAGDMSVLTVGPDFVSELMDDPEAYFAFLQSALGTFDAELDLLLTLPEDLTGGAFPGQIPLNLALVDGVGYLDFGALSEALGEEMFPPFIPAGWAGLDFNDVLASVADMGVLDQAFAMQEGMDMDGFAAFADPAVLEAFITITRLPDETAADGTEVAVFQTEFDYGALLASDAFRDAMTAAAESAGEEMTEEDLADLDIMFSGLGDALDLTFVQTVGLEDFYIYSIEMNLDFDAGELMAAVEDDIPAPDGEAVMFGITFFAEISNHNGDQTITAPADAPVATFADLMDLGAQPEPQG